MTFPIGIGGIIMAIITATYVYLVDRAWAKGGREEGVFTIGYYSIPYLLCWIVYLIGGLCLK